MNDEDLRLELSTGCFKQLPSRRFFPKAGRNWFLEDLPIWAVAMLNTCDESELILGVNEDGKPVGMDLPLRYLDEVSLAASAALRDVWPHLDPRDFDMQLAPLSNSDLNKNQDICKKFVVRFHFRRGLAGSIYAHKGLCYTIGEKYGHPVLSGTLEPSSPEVPLGQCALAVCFASLGRYALPTDEGGIVPLGVVGHTIGHGVTVYTLAFNFSDVWTHVGELIVSENNDSDTLRSLRAAHTSNVKTDPIDLDMGKAEPPRKLVKAGQEVPVMLVRARWINWDGTPERASLQPGFCMCNRCVRNDPATFGLWEMSFLERTSANAVTEKELELLWCAAKEQYESGMGKNIPSVVTRFTADYFTHVCRERATKKNFPLPRFPFVERVGQRLTPEDSRTEYKANLGKTGRLLRQVQAFLNGRGGDLLFGVDNTSKVVGVPYFGGLVPAIHKEVLQALTRMRPVANSNVAAIQSIAVKGDAARTEHWWHRGLKPVTAGTGDADGGDDAAERLIPSFATAPSTETTKSIVVHLSLRMGAHSVYMFAPYEAISSWPAVRTIAGTQNLHSGIMARRMQRALAHRTEMLHAAPMKIRARGGPEDEGDDSRSGRGGKRGKRSR
eukprot:TRINITY_DN12453_c0_g1_i1.p1 TRINITY_DN12453_c0_g1~~TRINITY_DN12453_c0_g1_i1.p1  ORF type:complete len:619 (-),score=68.64 TRINITY_DN12453_c0_g1_i1:30-1865(-)